MDLKALCKALQGSINHHANVEVATLQGSVSQLISHLASMFPDKADELYQLNTDMQNNARANRQRDVTVHSYFSGQGPIAKKLREHLFVADFFDQTIHPPSDAGGGMMIGKSPPSTWVHPRLEAFDFKPIVGQEPVRAVMAFLQECRAHVLNTHFASPKPALPIQSSMPNLVTGLYSDVNDKELSMILRGELPGTNGMEVMFTMFAEQAANIWFYHPYEMVWINGDFTCTFPQVLEVLQAEYQKALDAASPITEDFDFIKELDRVQAKMYEIFDGEVVMPPRLFYYKDGVAQEPTGPFAPISTYRRDPEDSVLSVGVEKIYLVFRNTRGAYPLRSRQLCTYVTPVAQSSVIPEKLPLKTQQLLVQKANQAAAVYSDIIRSLAPKETA